MAPAEAALSAIVSSLLSAFDSSRQLLHRIKNNVQPSKSRLSRKNSPVQDQTGDEEAQARNEQMQLRHARQRIAQTYERNSGKYGMRYRHGDDRAKTSLNHTLLVLNTGLMNIISNLLQQGTNNKSPKFRNEARNSLLSLSEESARDVLMELEELRLRLASMASLPVSVQQQRQQRNPKQLEEGKKSHKGRQGTAKTRQIEQKNIKKKTVDSTTSLGVVSGKKLVTATESTPRQTTTSGKTRNGKQHTNGTSNKFGYLATSRASSSSSPNLVLSPSQREYPHTTRQLATRGNDRLSLLSHSSGSTKLGEIPQHKWINPWVPSVETGYEKEEEHYQQEDDGKRRHGLRFWRRFGRNGEHA